MFVTMLVTMLHLREQEMFHGFCDPISRGGQAPTGCTPALHVLIFPLNLITSVTIILIDVHVLTLS